MNVRVSLRRFMRHMMLVWLALFALTAMASPLCAYSHAIGAANPFGGLGIEFRAATVAHGNLATDHGSSSVCAHSASGAMDNAITVSGDFEPLVMMISVAPYRLPLHPFQAARAHYRPAFAALHPLTISRRLRL